MTCLATSPSFSSSPRSLAGLIITSLHFYFNHVIGLQCFSPCIFIRTSGFKNLGIIGLKGMFILQRCKKPRALSSSRSHRYLAVHSGLETRLLTSDHSPLDTFSLGEDVQDQESSIRAIATTRTAVPPPGAPLSPQ